MALVVRDLGPLEIEWEGTLVRPRPHLQATLLAALVVDHHAVVPSDRLVDVLWPAGGAPAERLWFHVSRLRHLIPGGPALVERLAHGYRFAPIDAQLDSARFERLVADATGRAESDAAAALDVLDEALGLWRGEFHEGVDVDRSAPGVRHFWAEQRPAVEEQRLRLGLRVRPPGAVIPELERLATAHPEREVVVELLARALYAEGRQVDALDAIRYAATRLGDRHGLHPSPSSRALEAQILAQAPELDAGVAPTDGRASPGSMPTWTTTFVGRDDHVAEAARLLTTHRLVTLVGTAGVGKTRLACAVATRLASADPATRHVFVDLSTTRDASVAGDVLAEAFGLRPARDALEAVQRRLRWTPHFVVVDNCEHVLARAAELVAAILASLASVRVLATSREPLHLDGERVLRVPPLAVPSDAAHDGRATTDAERLFWDRAGTDVAWRADAAGTVATIVERLAGLPLAIELAAARTRALSPGEVADCLDGQLDLLTSGSRSSPERHRTLRASLDWSWSLLDDRERRTLARLSVFAAGFDLADAVAIAAHDATGASAGAAALGDLVEHSLVERSGSALPFRLLEPVRQYAIERLERSGETYEVRRRHADHFTAMAAETSTRCFGPHEAAAVKELLARAADYRMAATWASDHHEWEVFAGMVGALLNGALFIRGRWIEPANWSNRVVFDGPDPAPPSWALVAAGAAARANNLGHREQQHRAAALAVELDPSSAQAHVQLAIATARTDPLAAVARLDRARRTTRVDGPSDLLPLLVTRCSFLAVAAGGEALVAAADELASEARRASSTVGRAWARHFQGMAAARSDPWRGVAILDDGVRLAVAAESMIVEEAAGAARTTALLEVDALEAARRLVPYVRDRAPYMGDNTTYLDRALWQCVRVLDRLGDHETAALVAGGVNQSVLVRLLPADGAELDLSRVRRALGEQRFDDLCAQGAATDSVELVHIAVDALVAATRGGRASGSSG